MINRASLSFLDDRTVISLFVQTKDEPASRTLFCDGKSVVDRDFSPVVQVEGAGIRLQGHPFPKDFFCISQEDLECVKAKQPDVLDLYQRIRTNFSKCIYVPEGSEFLYDCATVFAMLTWLRISETYPYLHIQGAKGSGKTTWLEAMECCVLNPVQVSGATQAFIHRMLDASAATMLYDEAEHSRSVNDVSLGINQILRAGYKRGGAIGICKPKQENDYQPVKLYVEGPKVIAGINPLEPALADRCIVIHQCKKPKSMKTDRVRSLDWPRPAEMISLVAWHGKNLRSDWLDKNRQVGLRTDEIWGPLVFLAEWLESMGARGVLENITAARDFLNNPEEVETNEAVLQACIRGLIQLRKSKERPKPQRVANFVTTANPGLFDEYGILTAKKVSSLLGSIDIRTTGQVGAKEYTQSVDSLYRKVQMYFESGFDVPDVPDVTGGEA